MRAWLIKVEESLLGPLGPDLGVLALLAFGAQGERQQRLNEVMEWRQQRATLVAKGTIATAVGFVTSLVLSAFKAELEMPAALFIGALGGAVVVALCGLYVLSRAKLVEVEYALLLALLRLLP